MDKLYQNGIIYRNDIEHVYEGIFLKAVTSFESFIENLFIGILYKKYKFSSRRRLARVYFDSKQITTDIILNGNAYVDWLPFEKLEKRSKVFFDEGIPFTSLNQNDKSYLKQILSIRNAIAHKSPYSDEKFRNQVVAQTPGLPDIHKTPAGFLRYVYRTGPDQTKFENYLIELSNIANKIASFH